jgi:hypothetical protein
MPIKITQFKYAGKWGPFKIKATCEECDLSTGILEDMVKNEFRGKDVVFEKKPWLDNWIFCFVRGARHAPIIMVDGKKFYSYSEKNPLFDRKKLVDVVQEKLNRKWEE